MAATAKPRGCGGFCKAREEATYNRGRAILSNGEKGAYADCGDGGCGGGDRQTAPVHQPSAGTGWKSWQTPTDGASLMSVWFHFWVEE